MTDDGYPELPIAMRVREVADVLRCSTETVHRMIEDGRLRAVRYRGMIRVPRHALLEFLDDPTSAET